MFARWAWSLEFASESTPLEPPPTTDMVRTGFHLYLWQRQLHFTASCFCSGSRLFTFNPKHKFSLCYPNHSQDSDPLCYHHVCCTLTNQLKHAGKITAAMNDTAPHSMREYVPTFQLPTQKIFVGSVRLSRAGVFLWINSVHDTSTPFRHKGVFIDQWSHFLLMSIWTTSSFLSKEDLLLPLQDNL